jgi:hypothetical protein
MIVELRSVPNLVLVREAWCPASADRDLPPDVPSVLVDGSAFQGRRA